MLACAGIALLTPAAVRAELGSALAQRAALALEAGAGSRMAPTRTHEETRADWTWLQLALHDETYPLTVDIVGSAVTPASKVMYMLAGGSTNFTGSFFTPRERNLAHFMGEHGYLVIGVSPREDNAPSDSANYRFMEAWGLQKHSDDVHSVVTQLQAALALPYEVLGHSYGAMTALDYAARFSDAAGPARVIALDIYALDTESDPKLRQDALRTYQAHVQLLGRGRYVDTEYALLKPAKSFAVSTPTLDSGQSRSDYGHTGTFSFEALLFATLIDSSRTAGLHTELTGLPGDWLFKGGAVAGRYVFADDPSQDRYAFTRTRFDVLLATVDATQSGLIAVALERDVWAVSAGDPAYRIDWAAIRQPVIWINSEFGYGPHRDAAKRIRAAGNTQVVDDVLLGYGHGDMLWGEAARDDLWERLLP
jgi:pimeloyl-ACP methyl ester carboxylesterase